MNPIQKYTEELNKLSKDEVLHICYNLIQSNKLSYADLSQAYVSALKEKEEKSRELICELGFSLVMYKDKVTGGTWKDAEIKANKALVESRLFKGTSYEAKLLEKIKE